jgi:hypothetical protein
MKRQWVFGLFALGLALLTAAALNFALLSPAAAQTRTPTPRPTSSLRLQTQPISRFTATPSTTRGQVRLSWNYSGSAFRGNFVVERSNNQMAWSPVSACRLPYSYGKTTYSCTDSGLVSKRTYYYRLCTSTSTTCAGNVLTATVTVR